MQSKPSTLVTRDIRPKCSLPTSGLDMPRVAAPITIAFTSALGIGCSRGAQFSWRQGAPCPTARFEAMGAVVGGELIVLGGFITAQLDVTSTVQVYDPVREGWRDAVPLPDAQTHVGVALSGADVVLAGGFRGPVALSVDEVWLRRTSDGEFVPLPALPHPRAALGLVHLPDGIHAVGGLASDGVSDTGEHTLLTPNGWIARASLPNPRNHLGAASLGSLLSVVGGRHGWDEASGDQSSFDEYDPVLDMWRARAPLPQPASEITASTFATPTGKMVVAGGSIAGARPTAAVYLYDPRADGWTRLPDLPGPRKGAVAVAIGEEIIVTTGSPTGVDPSGTTWHGCCLR